MGEAMRQRVGMIGGGVQPVLIGVLQQPDQPLGVFTRRTVDDPERVLFMQRHETLHHCIDRIAVIGGADGRRAIRFRMYGRETGRGERGGEQGKAGGGAENDELRFWLTMTGVTRWVGTLRGLLSLQDIHCGLPQDD